MSATMPTPAAGDRADQSTSVRRLKAVEEMSAATADDRGRKVLAAAAAMRNVQADTVADHIRDLLDSGAWRDYVLPNGQTYAWTEAEFDYFLTVAGIDPELVDHVVRGSGDRALLLAVAQATDGSHPDRRTVEQVVAVYPDLAGRLAARPLGGDAVRRVARKPAAQADYLAGVGADAAVNPRQQWRVRWHGTNATAAAADAIVTALRRDPTLADAVLKRLSAKPR